MKRVSEWEDIIIPAAQATSLRTGKIRLSRKQGEGILVVDFQEIEGHPWGKAFAFTGRNVVELQKTIYGWLHSKQLLDDPTAHKAVQCFYDNLREEYFQVIFPLL